MGFLACSITKEEMVGRRPELATRRGFGSPFFTIIFLCLLVCISACFLCLFIFLLPLFVYCLVCICLFLFHACLFIFLFVFVAIARLLVAFVSLFVALVFIFSLTRILFAPLLQTSTHPLGVFCSAVMLLSVRHARKNNHDKQFCQHSYF